MYVQNISFDLKIFKTHKFVHGLHIYLFIFLMLDLYGDSKSLETFLIYNGNHKGKIILKLLQITK